MVDHRSPLLATRSITRGGGWLLPGTKSCQRRRKKEGNPGANTAFFISFWVGKGSDNGKSFEGSSGAGLKARLYFPTNYLRLREHMAACCGPSVRLQQPRRYPSYDIDIYPGTLWHALRRRISEIIKRISEIIKRISEIIISVKFTPGQILAPTPTAALRGSHTLLSRRRLQYDAWTCAC